MILTSRQVILFLTLPGALRLASAATCESLAGLALPNTVIGIAQVVPAGPFTPPGSRPLQIAQPFCRVAGSIQPSPDSDIRFEVWMPAAGWNGKLEGVGNGGFAGEMGYDVMAQVVARGYAVSATDTGHQGGPTDAKWAPGHPEKVIDFGYRAIHETADKAKAVVRAFYGDGPRRSYFNSCSDGGREALMEAQRFPGDYDGIIAGAPANSWTRLVTKSIWNMQTTLSDPATYIPAAKLPPIEAATLAACDSLDGVKDGVIGNPVRCRFDPSTLLCQGPDSDACLTAPQVAALKKLYAGPQTSGGRRVFPGVVPGGAPGFNGWGGWIAGAAPGQSLEMAFGAAFFAYMVYENAAWDFKTFQLDRDFKAADEKLARTLNATDPDLQRFRQRGGKLILYHGWSDAAISPLNTIDYYNSVIATMGAKTAGGFVRLFLAPGMQHCIGGPGPDSFGQMGAPQNDPQHDINSALERWVEQGVAPAQIVATKYKTGSNPASGVVRTRPLCPYPQVARWKGSGSTDDAANFVCAAEAPPK